MIYRQVNNIKEILRFIKDEKGFSKQEMLQFIKGDKVFHSPYLLTNMQEAADKIIYYATNNKHITIIGDYDVDGVCSTAVLYKTLKAITPNIHYIIPNRFTDGYGISEHLIDKAEQHNTSLIVTVDNGIKAYNEVQYAKRKNIDVVITDHHAFESETLPCDITVNPQIDNNYPFKRICGCMVAYKLCLVLIKRCNLTVDKQELAHLTVLATVADVMPLLDENRWFVKKYMPTLQQTTNIGLKTLITTLQKTSISIVDIGFYIAPCLNAAGRMESADYALKLLLTDNQQEAEQLASYIVQLNEERKKIQKQVLNDIKIDDKHNVLFCVLAAKNVSGILGIIASEIVNLYHKPCFVLSEYNDMYTGSGRSTNDYALNRIIELNSYVEGGGHKGACGLSFKKQDLNRLQQFADNDYMQYISTLPAIQQVRMQINFDLINERLINNLNKLQPYGEGNQQPIFHSINVAIESYKIVGKNKNILQFIFKQNGITHKGVMFGKKELPIPLSQIVQIDYSLDYNEWNGYKNIQLRVIHIDA